MNGRRAVELANGQFWDFVRRLTEETAMDLVASIPNLEAEDLAIVVADFEAARSFVLFELQTRLGFWRQLPWVFAAFADWNVEAARQAVARTLSTFDCVPQDPAQHHRIPLSCLAPGSDKRRALDVFRDGASLAEYPTLYQAIAELVFKKGSAAS